MTHRGAFIVSRAEGLALLAAAGAAGRCRLRVRQRLHSSAQLATWQVLHMLEVCGWARFGKLPAPNVPGFGSSSSGNCLYHAASARSRCDIALTVEQWCCARMAAQYHHVPGQCMSSGTCELLSRLLVEAGTSAAQRSGLTFTTPAGRLLDAKLPKSAETQGRASGENRQQNRTRQ